MLDLRLLFLRATPQQHGGYCLNAGPFGVRGHVQTSQYSKRIAALIDFLYRANLHDV
jgi:hypothetical protein